jgi:UDPglucose--hexose-1-phosphate uridylyltransferase
MAELRQDVITGLWVVVATDRALRPVNFSAACVVPTPDDLEKCPFEPGHEVMTPLEVLAIRPNDSEPNASGWCVRVVPNKFPAFNMGNEEMDSDGLFPRRAADGSHEVIIHSPSHTESLGTMPVDEVELVLRVYRHRYRANAEDPHIRCVHIIVNKGREAGASLEHSHSQLFGMPLVPLLLQQELAGASWYQSRHEECVFCRLIADELAISRRIVAKNRSFVAIAPFASRLPYEVWILPREHQESFDMISETELEEFAEILSSTLGKYNEKFGDPPYNYYIHSCPTDGAEYPYYHWHLEMVPKLTTIGGFELGTSMMINITTPEHAADFLTGRSDKGMGAA